MNVAYVYRVHTLPAYKIWRMRAQLSRVKDAYENAGSRLSWRLKPCGRSVGLNVHAFWFVVRQSFARDIFKWL